MIKVMFICHGNICRSPMAEFVMKDIVKKAGMTDEFDISSAATSTEELGNNVYLPVRKVLEKHSIKVDNRQARQMTLEDYRNSDYIITMDYGNIRNIQRIIRFDSDDKIHLLLDFTEKGGIIVDPWYTRDFDKTFDDISEGCQALFEYLTKK